MHLTEEQATALCHESELFLQLLLKETGAAQNAARMASGVPIDTPGPVTNEAFLINLARQVYDMGKGGNKIQAIKEVRAKTSMGLKEAKDFVEKHCADLKMRP